MSMSWRYLMDNSYVIYQLENHLELCACRIDDCGCMGDCLVAKAIVQILVAWLQIYITIYITIYVIYFTLNLRNALDFTGFFSMI